MRERGKREKEGERERNIDKEKERERLACKPTCETVHYLGPSA